MKPAPNLTPNRADQLRRLKPGSARARAAGCTCDPVDRNHYIIKWSPELNPPDWVFLVRESSDVKNESVRVTANEFFDALDACPIHGIDDTPGA